MGSGGGCEGRSGVGVVEVDVKVGVGWDGGRGRGTGTGRGRGKNMPPGNTNATLLQASPHEGVRCIYPLALSLDGEQDGALSGDHST